jgi:hypothetical protein
MKTLKKSGDLREVLLNAINDVQTGQLEEGQARNVIKLAGQVNESLYAECKVTSLKRDMGQESEKFGDLNLL